MLYVVYWWHKSCLYLFNINMVYLLNICTLYIYLTYMYYSWCLFEKLTCFSFSKRSYFQSPGWCRASTLPPCPLLTWSGTCQWNISGTVGVTVAVSQWGSQYRGSCLGLICSVCSKPHSSCQEYKLHNRSSNNQALNLSQSEEVKIMIYFSCHLAF